MMRTVADNADETLSTDARIELRRKHFIILPKDKRNYKVCPVTATLPPRFSEI